MLLSVLRLWVVVLTANLLGTLIFAWTVGHSDIFKPDIKANFRVLGVESIDSKFLSILLRAVFAGWLIALMKWMLPFRQNVPYFSHRYHHIHYRYRRVFAYRRRVGKNPLRRLRRGDLMGGLPGQVHGPYPYRQHCRRSVSRSRNKPCPGSFRVRQNVKA